MQHNEQKSDKQDSFVVCSNYLSQALRALFAAFDVLIKNEEQKDFLQKRWEQKKCFETLNKLLKQDHLLREAKAIDAQANNVTEEKIEEKEIINRLQEMEKLIAVLKELEEICKECLSHPTTQAGWFHSENLDTSLSTPLTNIKGYAKKLHKSFEDRHKQMQKTVQELSLEWEEVKIENLDTKFSNFFKSLFEPVENDYVNSGCMGCFATFFNTFGFGDRYSLCTIASRLANGKNKLLSVSPVAALEAIDFAKPNSFLIRPKDMEPGSSILCDNLFARSFTVGLNASLYIQSRLILINKILPNFLGMSSADSKKPESLSIEQIAKIKVYLLDIERCLEYLAIQSKALVDTFKVVANSANQSNDKKLLTSQIKILDSQVKTIEKREKTLLPLIEYHRKALALYNAMATVTHDQQQLRM